MKFRFEKNLRVFEELLGYCYKRGGTQIDSSITFDKEATYLKIESRVEGLTESSLKELSQMLNKKRQREIEECYWLANGENSLGDELELVSVMIDEAIVSYNDNILCFQIKRKEN